MLPLHNRHTDKQFTYLTDYQAQNPFRVIQDFFEDFSLAEVFHNLYEELFACLTSEHPSYGKPEQRACLVQQIERLMPVIESAWLIYEHHRTDGVVILC